MLHRVKDLSPEQKHDSEILLGPPVSDDGAVSINSLDLTTIIPAPLESPQERMAALRALEARFAATNAPEVSVQEEDELVREAFRSTRSDRPSR
jgi:hypothetical protein